MQHYQKFKKYEISHPNFVFLLDFSDCNSVVLRNYATSMMFLKQNKFVIVWDEAATVDWIVFGIQIF